MSIPMETGSAQRTDCQISKILVTPLPKGDYSIMAETNKGEFLLGVLVGATVGAAIALLYAPAPGAETRDRVKSTATDAMDRANEVASTVKDKAVDIGSKAQDVASNVRGKATDVASTVKDRASDVASTVRDRASDVAARASDVASTVKSRVQEVTSKGHDAVDHAVDSAVDAVTGGNSQSSGDDNWAAQLPDTDAGDKTKRRDLHELETSNDPAVVTDRINDAMQGSGEEAHKIAEELSKAPS